MLNIIYGKANMGKTYEVKRLIAEMILKDSSEVLLITPEQDSFRCESDILSLVGADKSDMAQVLSFKRFAKKTVDASFPGRKPPIDENCRRVIMSMALESVSDSLDIFASCRSGDAVGGMLGITDEFSQCLVSGEKLIDASDRSENETLKKKARELQLIIDAYNAIVSGSFSDPKDEITLCADIVRGSNIMDGKTVFIDGFSGYTAQEYALIGALMEKCRDVYVTVCCDTATGSKAVTDVFYYTFSTIRRLRAIAARANVQVKTHECSFFGGAEATLRLFYERGYMPDSQSIESPAPNITLCYAKDPADEAAFAARTIRRLVREKGYRYGDFAVIERGNEYVKYLAAEFKKYDIPYFEDNRRLMKNEALLRLADGALYCAVRGFDTEYILKCLKTSLYADLDTDDISELENYTVVWGIDGRRWLEEWTRHPDGYGYEINAAAEKRLERLNELRNKVTAPLLRLRRGLENADSSECVKALYNFLIYCSADKNLLKTAQTLASAGREDLALRSERVWDAFMDMLDRLNTSMGGRAVTPQRFYELFKTSVDKADIGDIPQVFDRVAVGDALRIRVENVAVVFIVGANEGVFPQNNHASFVLTPAERRMLKAQDIELYEDGELFASKERFLVYNALVKPSDNLFVSCSASDMSGNDMLPSEIFREVKRAAPQCAETETVSSDLLDCAQNAESAFETAAAHYRDNGVKAASVRSFVMQNPDFAGRMEALARAAQERTARIEKKENAEALFGKDMYLSPSAIENYHKCPFQYFCKFGLRAKPLKKAEMNAAVHGLVVHYVLENVFRRYTNSELTAMSADERIKLVSELTDDYIKNQMSGETDERMQYRMRRIKETVDSILQRLISEFSSCAFEVADVELDVGRGGSVPEYTLSLPSGGSISLFGTVDRVDVMKLGGDSFVRVIDYKTGGKEFKISDVPSGLNLQMLIYLMCLWKNGSERYGNVVPAGVLYLPAKNPDASLSRDADEREIASAKIKGGRMNGVILADERVVKGMDATGEGAFLSDKIIKNGNMGKYALSMPRFVKLKEAVDDAVRKTAEELQTGHIPVLPTLDGSYKHTCDYCDYRSVCCREDGDTRCNVLNKSEDWLFDSEEE